MCLSCCLYRWYCYHKQWSLILPFRNLGLWLVKVLSWDWSYSIKGWYCYLKRNCIDILKETIVLNCNTVVEMTKGSELTACRGRSPQQGTMRTTACGNFGRELMGDIFISTFSLTIALLFSWIGPISSEVCTARCNLTYVFLGPLLSASIL